VTLIAGCQLSEAPVLEDNSRRVTIWSPTSGARQATPLDGFYSCREIKLRGDRRIFLEAQEGSGRSSVEHRFEWNRAKEGFETITAVPPDDSASRGDSTPKHILVTASGRVVTLTNPDAKTWQTRLYQNGWRDIDTPPWTNLVQATALDFEGGGLLLANGNDGASMRAFLLPPGETHWTTLPPTSPEDSARNKLGAKLFSGGGGKIVGFLDQQGVQRRLMVWEPRTGHISEAPGPTDLPMWGVVASLDPEHLLLVGGLAAPGEQERNPALYYLYPLFGACVLLGLAAIAYLATRRTTQEAAPLIVGGLAGGAIFVVLLVALLVHGLANARYN
jgi:hypothetical protein